MDLEKVKQQLFAVGYVKVMANSGIWQILEPSDYNDNTLILRNIDTQYTGKFYIFANGKQRITPLNEEEMIAAGVGKPNVTYSEAEVLEVFEEEEAQKKKEKKKKSVKKKTTRKKAKKSGTTKRTKYN